jgi:predicted nucleotidyltransferase
LPAGIIEKIGIWRSGLNAQARESELFWGAKSAMVKHMDPLAIMQGRMDELRKLGARRIGIFGSFAKGNADANSDVDVYIEFEESKRTYDNLFAIGELLEHAFGRRVDLVTDKSLSDTKAELILPTVRYAA